MKHPDTFENLPGDYEVLGKKVEMLVAAEAKLMRTFSGSFLLIGLVYILSSSVLFYRVSALKSNVQDLNSTVGIMKQKVTGLKDISALYEEGSRHLCAIQAGAKLFAPAVNTANMQVVNTVCAAQFNARICQETTSNEIAAQDR